MPYNRAQLIAAARADHPELAKVNEDKILAAIGSDHPEILKGMTPDPTPMQAGWNQFKSTASDLTSSFANGIPKAATGIPGSLAAMLSAVGDPVKEAQLGVAAFNGMAQPFIPLARALQNKPISDEQLGRSADAGGTMTGQFAIPAAGELAGMLRATDIPGTGLDLPSSGVPGALRTKLAGALMGSAADNRAAAEGAKSPMASTMTGNVINAARRAYEPAAASVKEGLAKLLASGKVAQINNGVTVPPNAPMGIDELHSAPVIQDGLRANNPNPANSLDVNRAPAGTPIYDNGADVMHPESSRLGIPRPEAPTSIDVGVASEAPKTIDAPTINKWLGVRPRDVLYGADPGQRLIDENLIGANKIETAANIDRTMPSASADLNKALAKADASGKTVNAATVFNDAVANAVKKAGIKTDEAFMKGIEQLQTDAVAQFGELDKLAPSQAHKLKVWIQQSTDFGSNPATQNVSNNFFKTVGGGINTALKAVDADIAPAMSRWGDLAIAAKSLRQSMANNVVGRGTPSTVPTIETPAIKGIVQELVKKRINL